MLRKILYTAIALLSIFFITQNLEEIQLIFLAFKKSDLRWLSVAMLAHALWLVLIAGSFWACYRLMGIDEKLGHLVPLTIAANFINVVAPSYGVGALAVLIADGSQRGKPIGKITAATFVFLVSDYLGFLVALAAGFSILNQRGLLDGILVVAAAFAVTIAMVLLILTAIGVRSATQLDRAILWVVDLANRLLKPLLKREVINRSEAHTFALDIADGLLQIRRSPRKLILPGILALIRPAMMVVILFFVSLAFHTPFGIETLLASYSVSYLFIIASITPSGVGFVESAMVLIQNGMGVDPLTSTAIALTYRGITFWLTLAYGLIALRMIGRHTHHSSRDGADPARQSLTPSSEAGLIEGNPGVDLM